MKIEQFIEKFHGKDISPGKYLSLVAALKNIESGQIDTTLERVYRRLCHLCRGEVEHYTTKVTYVKGLGWAHVVRYDYNIHEVPRPIKCHANNVRPNRLCSGLNWGKVFMPCTEIAEDGSEYCNEHSGMRPLQDRSDVEYFERTVNGVFYQCREERQTGEQRTERRRLYDQVSGDIPELIRHTLTRRMEQRRKSG